MEWSLENERHQPWNDLVDSAFQNLSAQISSNEIVFGVLSAKDVGK